MKTISKCFLAGLIFTVVSCKETNSEAAPSEYDQSQTSDTIATEDHGGGMGNGVKNDQENGGGSVGNGVMDNSDDGGGTGDSGGNGVIKKGQVLETVQNQMLIMEEEME